MASGIESNTTASKPYRASGPCRAAERSNEAANPRFVLSVLSVLSVLLALMALPACGDPDEYPDLSEESQSSTPDVDRSVAATKWNRHKRWNRRKNPCKTASSPEGLNNRLSVSLYQDRFGRGGFFSKNFSTNGTRFDSCKSFVPKYRWSGALPCNETDIDGGNGQCDLSNDVESIKICNDTETDPVTGLCVVFYAEENYQGAKSSRFISELKSNECHVWDIFGNLKNNIESFKYRSRASEQDCK